ncbi:MAG: hypothetical protein Ct9H300mP11_30660 [Chloroflexota bacterium]|nr:MAG: hypothetical protein Ct9H300mP11_30660 [Chloroflexota bacterium]
MNDPSKLLCRKARVHWSLMAELTLGRPSLADRRGFEFRSFTFRTQRRETLGIDVSHPAGCNCRSVACTHIYRSLVPERPRPDSQDGTRLLGGELNLGLLRSAKRMGFSDNQIGTLADMLRNKCVINAASGVSGPSIKQWTHAQLNLRPSPLIITALMTKRMRRTFRREKSGCYRQWPDPNRSRHRIRLLQCSCATALSEAGCEA